MKKIKLVGVVGAGTMGAALAQKFAQEGFNVILCDRERSFLERGMSGIKKMLNEGLEKKVFTKDQVDNCLANIIDSLDLSDLRACDIVIEAIFENFEAKSQLFRELTSILHKDAVIATNTSSFSVTELARSVDHPERFIGLHYFYHAAKNRLVEIIPGEKTSGETIKAAYRFSVLSGKDPIYTKDRYGFAVNRFFVPWLNEAVKLLDEGIGTIEIIDSVCMKVFGIGMGPFALMNATGVAIALHAQRTLEKFGPSYKVSPLLEKQVEKKENWPIKEFNPAEGLEAEKKITARMLGCIFFICSQILEEKVCTPIDLNKGAKIGLRWRKGPIDLMKQFGDAEVQQLVEHYSSHYNERMPKVSPDHWKMDFVTLEIKNNCAVITVNRPEDLNALNEDIVRQLDEKFSEAERDALIEAIFITGSGKAFVAGADIKFFVRNIKNKSLDKIVEFTSYGQRVFDKIDKSKKKVVALINGIALGGGLELALCADVILAGPKAMFAFPETGIGIYPGLGGTQRTAKRVGKGLAKYLILTGKNLSATEAFDVGLIDAVISMDDAFDMMDGQKPIPSSAYHSRKDKWIAIDNFYSHNTYKNIIAGNCSNGIPQAEIEKLTKVMSTKAPVAMQIAEKLIDEQRGLQSELENLTTIFSTKDAMLGLSSIGKKVTFEGS